MRYVHFLNSIDLNLGGVTAAVLSLCEHLQRAGGEVYLATRKSMDHVREWTQDNPDYPTLIELPGDRNGLLPLDGEERRYLAEWLQPQDVVHLHGMWELATHDFARVCRMQGVPYCVSSHGMLDDWSMSQGWLKKRGFWLIYGRKYLSGAFAIHTTAQEERRQVEPWVVGRPVEVVPLIFPLDAFQKLPGPDIAADSLDIKSDEKVVLFLSRIHPKKGVEVVIDAMQEVRKAHANVRALLAGPGEEAYVDAIRELIASKGLDDCVELVGPVHGDAKLSLYQRADVFALPTHQENFGFVMPEAMACETAVVTTKGVDIWRELESAGARIVPRNAREFAREITNLLEDDDQRLHLGRLGREWVFDALDPQRVIQQFLDLYTTGRILSSA